MKTGRTIPWLGALIGILVVPVILSGCRIDEPQTSVYFIVQQEPAEIVLLASLPGELVLDEDGYLRVCDNIILWPYGYSYDVRDGEIRITDDEGREVARVGEWVSIGGGQINASFAAEKIGHDLPEGCTGPFWLAGGGIDDNHLPVNFSHISIVYYR
jgi:hypothetical protein